jgi:CRP-like cAMP-binding protein
VGADDPRGHHTDAAASAAPSDTFQEVFRDGSRRRFGSGAIVFSEGDVSNRVVLVLSGRLKVSVCSDGGHEVVLGYREGGDVLGEFRSP